MGIHLACAAAADAYATARLAGHPVITLIVGKALSGGFLAHGYQANRVLALDDPQVMVHAMGKEAAARVTKRTVAQLDELAAHVLPLAYDIRGFAQLGLVHELIGGVQADAPTGGGCRRRARSAGQGGRGCALRPLRSAQPPGIGGGTHEPRRLDQGARAAGGAMELRPHDLVRLSEPGAVLNADPAPPAWVAPALARAPFAVVRRCGAAPPGMVPVGVRGRTRSERFAAQVPVAAIAGCISTRAARPWNVPGSRRGAEHRCRPSRPWPPRRPGSTLWACPGDRSAASASSWRPGSRCSTAASDVDLLVRAAEPLDLGKLQALAARLATHAGPLRRAARARRRCRGPRRGLPRDTPARSSCAPPEGRGSSPGLGA